MPEILSNVFFHLGQSVGQRYIWYGLATNRDFFTIFHYIYKKIQEKPQKNIFKKKKN